MHRHSSPLSYAVAIGSVTVATIAAVLLQAVDKDPSPMFVVAVMCSAWFGGLGPGLLATILAGACAAIIFVEPPHSADFGTDDAVRVAVLLGVAVLVSYLQAASRRSIQALKEARDSAEAASRAKDHFLAVLSHELRTPLNPALVAISSLETDPALPPSAREDLRLARRNIELESRLIDDLLDVARLSRGKIQMRFENLDVHEVIRDAVRICQDESEQKEVPIHLELTAQKHIVRADPARLRQVFWNLLRNAIKFTPPHGSITIRTHNNSDGLFLASVQDTGIGMEPPALEKVFRPFEQGDSSISGRFGGMGLGLAISRELMTLHGGQLSATSDGKDRGACFTVQMCAVESPAATPRKQQDDSEILSDRDMAPRRTWRLLLVDDHRDTLRLLSQLLKRSGHDVATAATVAEALAVASRRVFDLVVSDLGLPDASGLDLMRSLRDQYPMRGIALSGYGAAEDVAASREAGFDLHLIKPVDFTRLLEAIDEVAAAPRPAVPAHV